MSLPGLKDVLRSIGLPGSPQKGAGSCGASSRKDRGNGTNAGNNVGSGSGSILTKDASSRQERERLTATPPGSRADMEETSSAGGRRRRLESDDMMPSDWDSPSTQSAVSEGSGSVSTTIGADASVGWGSASSYDDSDAAWDPGESLRHRQAMSALAVSPSGGHFGSSYSSTKRARLGSRSLSGLNEVRGSEDNDGRERSGGSGTRSKNTRSGSVLDQIYRHPPQSHSTEEWRAVQKAARVLGVDSLEERDVEDKQRFSMSKAASVLGVDNVEEFRELQQSAAGNRPKWAPPKSSASKAARIVGLGVEDVAELQIQASRQRNNDRRRSASAPGNRSRQHQQGSISCLIRALEITSTETQGSAAEQQGGVREEETGSAHSANSANSSVTRGTESCSSVSDLQMQDAEGSSECNAAGVAATRAGAAGSQGTKKSEVLPDDQLAGLQTPYHTAAADSSRNDGWNTRDDMEVETPPSQLSRSAALTSLKQAPAPLVAPYTPTMPSTCRSSPSPLGSVGPGPSPAGSPLGSTHLLTPRNGGITPASVVPARQPRSDFAVVGNGGEESPLSRRAGAAVKSGIGSQSVGEDVSPRLGTAAEGKGFNPHRSEALGSGWEMTTPAPSPITTTSVRTNTNTNMPSALVRGGQQEPSRLAKLGSPPTTPAPSPIEPHAWGSTNWTSQSTLAVAGSKDARHGRLHGMEYKQESPVGTSGEWSPPPANLAALKQSRGWRSPEAKREFHSPIPNDRVSWPLPERPSSAPIPGAQTQLSHNGRYSPTVNGFSREHRSKVSFVRSGRDRITQSERGTVSSDSSGDSSESASEAYPDRMDDGEDAGAGAGGDADMGAGTCGNSCGSGPASAFKELAAMIPVINPSGIGSRDGAASAGYPIKSEDGRGPVGTAGKAKQRRRQGQPRGFSWSEDSSGQVALSPLLPKAQDLGASALHGEQVVEAGGVPGISTRKQQEVATRPREKGRFVKRPPAFLPISAFKNAGDRTEADVAAERAEEAREEAVEAAERAAAAAAAVSQRSSTSSFSPVSSIGSPPATLASLSETGANKKPSCGGSAGDGAAGYSKRETVPWFSTANRSERGRAEDLRDASKGRNSMAVDVVAKHPSPISKCARSSRPTGNGVAGSGGIRQGAPQCAPVRGGRSEPVASPLSRVPHTGIWNQHDSDAEGSEVAGAGSEDHVAAAGGGGNGKDTSDCGSERGCDDLRGLQFLPFSPKDGISPRSSTWDSPRRGMFSAPGSAHSTPVHSHRRGHDGRPFGPNASPRPGPQGSELPPASPGGGIPWQGARGEPGCEAGPGGGARGDQGR